MFIGEQPSGSVTEFESRDATFLENDFPSRGEINQGLSLYEMEDPNDLINANQLLPIIENAPTASHPSESMTKNDKFILKESQVRRSNQGNVPRHHFDMKEKLS